MAAHFKQIFRISDCSKEILPESHFGLPSTVTNGLQKLRKLFYKVNNTRKKSIWEGGGGGEGKGRRKGEGKREREKDQAKGKGYIIILVVGGRGSFRSQSLPGTGMDPGASSSRISCSMSSRTWEK